MVVAKTLETILDDGIADAHFFNGRMLTAEALRTMRDANRLQHRQLAAAIGEGVAHGLRVSHKKEPSPPIEASEGPRLSITPGLAFNRLGEAIALRQPVDLKLASTKDDVSVEAGLFAECQPPSAFTNFGIYLLTIMPASGFSGFAPMVEIGGGVGTGCGRAFTVEGAKFRVFELPLTGLDATPLQAELTPQLQVIGEQIVKFSNEGASTVTKEMFRYRSSIAHYLLGSDIRIARSIDPFGAGADPQPGPIEMLRQEPQALLDCEVPLAILHWSRRGIEFVDEWAVRRMPAAPSPAGAVASLVAERRRGEALACILQFQRQLEDIMDARTAPQLLNVRATDYFRYLPSAGLVPRALDIFQGFAAKEFLEGIPHRPLEPPPEISSPPTELQRPNETAEFIPDESLRGLSMSALDYGPLDLVDSEDWKGPEMVWLYTPVRHQKALDDGAQVAPYIAFAAPQVPYISPARFDTARWDYSNYADCAGCDRAYRSRITRKA